MEKNSRPFLLILFLLTVFLAFLSINYKISKIEKYAESIESGVDTAYKFEADMRVDQINELLKQVNDLREENKFGKQADLEIARDLYKYARRQRRENEELKKILGFDGRYDKNNVLILDKSFEKLFDYKMYATVIFQMGPPDEFPDIKIDDIILNPLAIVIGEYVLMVSHVSEAEIIQKEAESTMQFMTPDGMVEKTFQFKVLGRKMAISLNGKEYVLEEKYRNPDKDFALFEITGKDFEMNFPFAVGFSSELKIGDFVYINGRPKIKSEVARPGHITALTIFPMKNGNGNFTSEMEISQSTDSGDSGSPIIAFRDGKPELVGIYLGWLSRDDDNGQNTRSRALKINEAVDEIKEKLGIDLRELQRQILSK